MLISVNFGHFFSFIIRNKNCEGKERVNTMLSHKKAKGHLPTIIFFNLLILFLFLAGCTPQDQALLDQLKDELADAISDEVGEISKTAVSSVGDLAKTEAAGVKETAQAGLATQVAEISDRLKGEDPDPWDISWLPNDQAFVIRNINQILNGSGLDGMGEFVLEYALAYQVNPAFALAMFQKEANFAKPGTIAYSNKNPGNIIATGGCRGLDRGSACTGNYGEVSTNGRFGIYATMQDGIKAYFMLLDRQYRPGAQYNCEDIPCIISVYAPSSENNTTLYISQITNWTKDFQAKILGQ
jgi:hypothetical protein